MTEYTFKKLGDVEALSEVPEGANAFIEVNGEVKRVPGDGLGGGAILDKNGKLQNTVLPEGYPSKEIFYDIQWDGNAEGIDSVAFDQFTFYKVSDEVLTEEQLIGSTLYINGAIESGFSPTDTCHVDESMIMTNEDSSVCIVAPGIPFIISTSVLSFTMSTYESAPETTLNFPSTGTYVLYMPGAAPRIAEAEPIDIFVSRLLKQSIQHISKEFLPDGYPYMGMKELTVIHIPTEENYGETELEGFPIFNLGDTVKIKVNGDEYELVPQGQVDDCFIGDTWDDVESGDGDYGWMAYSYEGKVVFYSPYACDVSYEGLGAFPIDEEYLPDSAGCIKTAIIKSSDYDSKLVDLQIDAPTPMATSAPEYECINMSFEEAYKTMAMGKPLNCLLMIVGEGCMNIHGVSAFAGTNIFNGTPCLVLMFSSLSQIVAQLYWTEDGLSTEAPIPPK